MTISLGKVIKVVDTAMRVSYEEYVIEVGEDALYFIYIDEDDYEVEFDTIETDTPETSALEVADLFRKVGLNVRIEKN